jgi:peptidoglycan/LPS O-acetylase OafA/YrhL
VGVVAVICFFIISGFVIHYPNKRGISNLKNFYTRRYIRVLLPLVVIFLVSIPFGNPENSVVWSLYCELIYYTIYPLLAIIKISWRSKTIIAFVLSGAAIIIGAPGDTVALVDGDRAGYDGQYWQLGYAWTWIVGLPCWLLGVLLAERIDSVATVVSRPKIYLFRVAMFAISIGLLIAQFHFFVSYIISLTIVSLLFVKWIEYEIQYFKNNKPVRFLESWGKFSYSLYLTHPLAYILILKFIPFTSYSYWLYVILAIAGAYAVYLVLERPSHLLAQSLTRRKAMAAPVE